MIMGRVEILWWLAPPAVVTVLAMLFVTWIGRERPERNELSEEARRKQQQRFAEAIMREHPTAHHVRRGSTGAPASPYVLPADPPEPGLPPV